MSKFYSVLEVTPTQEDWIPEYLGASGKTMAKYGGKYLARTPSHESFEGDRENPALRIIIEWPSRQAAVDFMNDPDYVPHKQARQASSISHHTLIEGKDEFAA